jgi:hypothetical protein
MPYAMPNGKTKEADKRNHPGMAAWTGNLRGFQFHSRVKVAAAGMGGERLAGLSASSPAGTEPPEPISRVKLWSDPQYFTPAREHHSFRFAVFPCSMLAAWQV